MRSDVIRARAVQYWTNVDAGLGQALAAALAGTAPLGTGEPGTASTPVA